jgi:hypothetical protein
MFPPTSTNGVLTKLQKLKPICNVMHGTQFCGLKGGHEEEESMSYSMLLHLTSASLSEVFAHIGLMESDANLHVMLQGRRMYRREDLCHCKSVVFILFAILFITLLCIILR